jgi:type I restriction-modification system DNA methylase subunit
MNNFLSLWESYLLANQGKLQSAREYGDLYESFIAQFPEMRKEFGVFYTPQYIIIHFVGIQTS